MPAGVSRLLLHPHLKLGYGRDRDAVKARAAEVVDQLSGESCSDDLPGRAGRCGGADVAQLGVALLSAHSSSYLACVR